MEAQDQAPSASSLRRQQPQLAQAAAPGLLRAQVPPGVRTGNTFNVTLPDGRVVAVMVPPGVNPGDVLGVPYPGKRSHPAQL